MEKWIKRVKWIAQWVVSYSCYIKKTIQETTAIPPPWTFDARKYYKARERERERLQNWMWVLLAKRLHIISTLVFHMHFHFFFIFIMLFLYLHILLHPLYSHYFLFFSSILDVLFVFFLLYFLFHILLTWYSTIQTIVYVCIYAHISSVVILSVVVLVVFYPFVSRPVEEGVCVRLLVDWRKKIIGMMCMYLWSLEMVLNLYYIHVYTCAKRT